MRIRTNTLIILWIVDGNIDVENRLPNNKPLWQWHYTLAWVLLGRYHSQWIKLTPLACEIQNKFLSFYVKSLNTHVFILFCCPKYIDKLYRVHGTSISVYLSCIPSESNSCTKLTFPGVVSFSRSAQQTQYVPNILRITIIKEGTAYPRISSSLPHKYAL